ncbi:MAG: thioredoxin family protein [Ignavibacteriaceae bacterium]
MKKILFLSIFLFIGLKIMAQSKDTLITDILSGRPMLLGVCNREALRDTNFSWWYESEYDLYNIDSSSLEKLSGKMNDIKITVVMGTWCSDSRREVPRFFKILDYLKYPSDSVTIIMVGRDKKGKSSEADNLKIEKVPTIIFYRNDKELGRIIESPTVTLEKDMLKIIGG